MDIEYVSIEGKKRSAGRKDGIRSEIISEEKGVVEFKADLAITETSDLGVIFSEVKKSIIGNPQYVSSDQLPWMLSHIDELIMYVKKGWLYNIERPKHYQGAFLQYNCIDKSPIYTIRFHYVMQFVLAHLYGGDLGSFQRASKTISFKKKAKLIGCLQSSIFYLPKDVVDFYQSSLFNLSLSWDLASRRVIFSGAHIRTDDEEINTILSDDHKSLIGTLGGTKGSKNPTLYKAILGSFSNKPQISNILEFDFSYFLPTHIFVQPSKGYTKQVRVNVPLDNITHFSGHPGNQFAKVEYIRITNSATGDSLDSRFIDQAIEKENRQIDIQLSQYGRWPSTFC